MRHGTITPEAFCWRYAAGCLEAKEHEIPKADFEYLQMCMTRGLVPPDDMVRRVFHRPFEALGKDCTLQTMQTYWRETHRTPKENTPVYRACVVNMIPEKTWPDGTWWRVWHVDYVTKRPFEGKMVHNVHRLDVEPGKVVYIHGNVVAEVTDDEPTL